MGFHVSAESPCAAVTACSEVRRKASASSSRSMFKNFIHPVRISQRTPSSSTKLMGVISCLVASTGPEQPLSTAVSMVGLAAHLWWGLLFPCPVDIQFIPLPSPCCQTCSSVFLQHAGIKTTVFIQLNIHQANAEVRFSLRFGNFCFLLTRLPGFVSKLSFVPHIQVRQLLWEHGEIIYHSSEKPLFLFSIPLSLHSLASLIIDLFHN